jgi:Amt family ammonium transporter
MLMVISSKWAFLISGGTVVHMSAGWAALAGAMFLGKRKTQKIKSSTYYLCVTWNWIIMVWLVWFQCWGLHLRQMVWQYRR